MILLGLFSNNDGHHCKLCVNFYTVSKIYGYLSFIFKESKYNLPLSSSGFLEFTLFNLACKL